MEFRGFRGFRGFRVYPPPYHRPSTRTPAKSLRYYGYCVVSPTLLSSDELEDAAFSELLASTIQNGHSCVLSLKAACLHFWGNWGVH